MHNREDIIRKLNAIKAKANNAATPEEAATFLAAFNKLMAKYKLTETDLEVKEAGIHTDYRKAGNAYTQKARNPIANVIVRIAELTDTKAITLGWDAYGFLGTPSDLQYAMWIYDLVSNTMERASLAYKLSLDYHKRINNHQKPVDVMYAYKVGFTHAINKALQAMIDERKVPGKSLVVLKHGLILAFMEANKIGEPSQVKALAIKSELNEIALEGMKEGEKVKLRKETTGTKIAGLLN